jgi:hypothetical protein
MDRKYSILQCIIQFIGTILKVILDRFMRLYIGTTFQNIFESFY